ncbi:PEP-CTERM sorting domain-containing protein [Rheinheimera muenzenbergensis]|uniref:PEP-CTERM sorting domain-containing protein n=1 Tax=Rheinheimera muenzenbergensis TaxID=1193628 RepID=A0ABU8CAM6_9GAMM
MKQRCLAALLLAGSAMSAQAAPIIFFGENQTDPFAIGADPAAAQTSFLSNLTGVGTEDFEGFSIPTIAPLDILFAGSTGNITATMTGGGQIANTTGAGRFNTSAGGSQWWEISGLFSINFDTAISAFGFFGTDIGDFDGQITVALLDINNVVTNLVIDNSINGINGANLFWGFIDVNNAYTSISFGNTAAGTDFFGFDDFTIGDRQQIRIPTVPEPATLAMFGLAICGLVTSRRQKK